jgi:hypothetical protein
MPNNVPVVRAEQADVEYLCEECSTVLAELPFMTTLSTIIGEVDEFADLDVNINVVKCPDCSSFNEFPHQNNRPRKDSSSSLDLDSNLAQLLRESEQLKKQEELDPEGHFIDPDTHLLNHWTDIHELSHEDLLRFPRYLSDAVFKTSPPRISYDHFLFWGWTAAYVTEHSIAKEDPFEELVNEYLSLVHVMLFKLRHIYSRIFYTREGISTEIDGRDISWEEAWRVIEWGNPSLGHLSVLPDRYAATTGFAVLEGLVNIHSDSLSIENGTLDAEVKSPWHPYESTLKGDVSYHDKIQIWRHHTARPETKDTLSLIDDLSRYEPSTLLANMAGVESIVDEELDSTNHFLRVVADQRNDNLHGQLPTRVIGNLITTLCSLLIWDAMPADDFEEHRKAVLEDIRSQEEEAYDDVMSAPAFMPVDRIQHLLDVDTITPADPRYPENLRHFNYE